MGIYIHGVTMPKNCITDDCPCLNRENCTCQADKEKRYIYGDRPYWCPLIELPPHGRLVDIDAIPKSAWRGEKEDLIDAIMFAPTIIPADGGAAG